jgi:hypothetical protein
VTLYKVTSGWLANGREGVLVQAASKDAALRQARDFLATDALIEMRRATPDSIMIEHHRERFRSYQNEPEQFHAIEIELPHKDEFG